MQQKRYTGCRIDTSMYRETCTPSQPERTVDSKSGINHKRKDVK